MVEVTSVETSKLTRGKQKRTNKKHQRISAPRAGRMEKSYHRVRDAATQSSQGYYGARLAWPSDSPPTNACS